MRERGPFGWKGFYKLGCLFGKAETKVKDSARKYCEWETVTASLCVVLSFSINCLENSEGQETT